MRLLLDTHVWIWASTNQRNLGRRVKRELADPKNQVYLSPISIWEASHLFANRRILAKEPFENWLDRVLDEVPLLEAPFNLQIAKQAARIRLPQGDPGDTILAATALALRLTLVTGDEQLLACSWLDTLAN